MTNPSSITSRRPPAPPALASWLLRELGGRPHSASELMHAGRAALDRARAHPGRRRDSAFELLGADALITRACEAALDEADPAQVLTGFIRAVATPRR